jgi:hypothetical protein
VCWHCGGGGGGQYAGQHIEGRAHGAATSSKVCMCARWGRGGRWGQHEGGACVAAWDSMIGQPPRPYTASLRAPQPLVSNVCVFPTSAGAGRVAMKRRLHSKPQTPHSSLHAKPHMLHPQPQPPHTPPSTPTPPLPVPLPRPKPHTAPRDPTRRVPTSAGAGRVAVAGLLVPVATLHVQHPHVIQQLAIRIHAPKHIHLHSTHSTQHAAQAPLPAAGVVSLHHASPVLCETAVVWDVNSWGGCCTGDLTAGCLHGDNTLLCLSPACYAAERHWGMHGALDTPCTSANTMCGRQSTAHCSPHTDTGYRTR